MEVSSQVSPIAAVPFVRAFVDGKLHEAGAKGRVVMDGRDIGTKVLPDAPVKVFLTASAEVRAQRRFLELQARGQEVPYEQLLSEIRQRDHNDATRAASPMVQAEDATLMDSSDMTIEEVTAAIIALAKKRMEAAR